MKEPIIKFTTVSKQTVGRITRLVGFIEPASLIEIIDNNNLGANPRLAKRNKITKAILESLEEDCESKNSNRPLFAFKTKGILLATSTPPKELEGGRYKLVLDDDAKVDRTTNGILDGGHNAFAILIYILWKILDKTIYGNTWDDIIPQLKENIDLIRKGIHTLDNIKIPIEIISPSTESDVDRNCYLTALSDIATARNNNVQLQETTKANYEGVYECLKNVLPDLKTFVQWTTNDGGRIKMSYIISLACIPFLNTKLEDDIRGVPTLSTKQIEGSRFSILYSSTQKPVHYFNELIKFPKVSDYKDNNYIVKHSLITSGLEMLPTIIHIYDYIECNFAAEFNTIDKVLIPINTVPTGKTKKTHFYQNACFYDIERGIFFPLVCGLETLIKKSNGRLTWKFDPMKLIEKHFNTIITIYSGAVIEGHSNPQSVSKGNHAYVKGREAFSHCLELEIGNKGNR